MKVRLMPISGWAFLFLFPGFFFYNYLVASGLASPVLGGYFGVVALSLAPLILFGYFRGLQKRVIVLNMLDVVFWLLMLYIVGVAVFNYIKGQHGGMDVELFRGTIGGALFNLVLYMMTRVIRFDDKVLKGVVFWCLVVMFALVVLNIGERGIYQTQDGVGGADALSTYQGLGRSLIVVAIFSLATANSKPMFFLVMSVSMISLLLNGARSEFVGLMASLFFIATVRYRVHNLILIGFLFAAAAMLVLLNLPPEIVENNRVFELTRIGESTSAMARDRLENNALKTIVDNPIFGGYGSYVLISGVGGYAHNLLSAWVDLGFLGFSVYVICLVWMGLVLLRNHRRSPQDSELQALAIGYFACTTLLMIFAKDYTYMIFGLSVGFVARVIDVNRCVRRVSYKVKGGSRYV